MGRRKLEDRRRPDHAIPVGQQKQTQPGPRPQIPVFLGDTITVTYTVEKIDKTARRTWAKVEIVNQDGELVTVGQHLLKWTPNKVPRR
jgi:hypothetical protein